MEVECHGVYWGMNWDQIHGHYKAKTEAKRLEVKEARKNADQPAQ